MPVTAINSKHIGDSFEQRFLSYVTERKRYIQQMPARVGFDFLVGADDGILPIELKCVIGGRLRMKHFTQIELICAEEMTEAGLPYTVVFPLFDRLGRVTWAEIREELMSGGVTLDKPQWEWSL
jgi:hypothetical protein